MRWISASIIRRLVATTLLVGLLTAVVGVTVVQLMERRNLVEDAVVRNLAAAEGAATRIDDRLVATGAQLRLITARPSVTAMTSDASSELAVSLRLSGDLDSLVLHDRAGHPVAAAASSVLLSPADLPDRDVPAGDLANPDREHSDERRSGTTIWAADDGVPSLEISVPVEDPPGTVVGDLVGRVPTALVAQEATAQLTAAVGTVYLTDGVGRIRAHPELGRVLEGEHFDLGVFADQPSATIDVDGKPTIVAGSRLQNVSGWIVVQQPKSEVVRPAAGTLSGFTLVFLAVVTAIIGAVVVTGGRLLRPLGPLVDAVGQVAKGDLEARVAPARTGEIAVLGHGFNTMAGSLEERASRLETAERAARTSEERLRLMVEGVTDHAIFLVGLDGSIQSWNAGGRRLLGYETKGALELTLEHIVRRDVGAVDPLVEAADSGRAQFEGWCLRQDGSRFLAQVAVTALTDDHGTSPTPSGYAVILHDLTDRQIAQAALEDALEREQHAARELRRTAELKDEFLAIAAHEIRTPLSAILGATQMLTQDDHGLGEEGQRRFHAIIETCAHDMHDIVERLLDFTRLQAGRVRFAPASFDLREAFERHLTLLARHLGEREVVVDAPRVEVVTDPELLRHVVTNLVANAAKFSPPDSTITITARVKGETLCVSVRDEGAGIAAHDHERVFELFRQSSRGHSASSGTGVGLAIVKRYVDLVGGEIDLDSAPGRGSTFTIRIPLRPHAPEALDSPEATTVHLSGPADVRASAGGSGSKGVAGERNHDPGG